MGNRSPRYNSLQGWSCPSKRSPFPLRLQFSQGRGAQLAVAVPPGMRGTAGCCSPCSWQSFSSHPGEMAGQEGRRAVAASVRTVHGLPQPTTAPPAFPSFTSVTERKKWWSSSCSVSPRVPVRAKSYRRKVLAFRWIARKVISLQRGLNHISFAIRRTIITWRLDWGLQTAVCSSFAVFYRTLI